MAVNDILMSIKVT